jgi:DNA repair protein RadA/Sms
VSGTCTTVAMVAVASAAADSPIRGDVVAVGEISLAGEIRPVSSAKQRESEAERMGFAMLLDDGMRSAQAAVHYALNGAAKDTQPRHGGLTALR